MLCGVSWDRGDTTTTCSDHPGQSWPNDSARTCQLCTAINSGIAEVVDESEMIDDQARTMGLATELEHERWFESFSRRLRAWAMAEREAGNAKGAHNFAAEAVKARKAAADMTRHRRDWFRYDRAAHAALRVKRGSPASVALSAAMRGASEREVSN